VDCDELLAFGEALPWADGPAVDHGEVESRGLERPPPVLEHDPRPLPGRGDARHPTRHGVTVCRCLRGCNHAHATARASSRFDDDLDITIQG
jgi:hypothetical protein